VHDDLASFLCIVCFNWGQLIIGLLEEIEAARPLVSSLFVRLVADGWCWFVLREKYCWLVGDG
jgi:hypothetical protein